MTKTDNLIWILELNLLLVGVTCGTYNVQNVLFSKSPLFPDGYSFPLGTEFRRLKTGSVISCGLQCAFFNSESCVAFDVKSTLPSAFQCRLKSSTLQKNESIHMPGHRYFQVQTIFNPTQAPTTTRVKITTDSRSDNTASTTVKLTGNIVDAAAKVKMYFNQKEKNTAYLLFSGLQVYVFNKFPLNHTAFVRVLPVSQLFEGANTRGAKKIQAAMVYSGGNNKIALLYDDGVVDYFDTLKDSWKFEHIGEESIKSPCSLDFSVLAVLDEDDSYDKCIYITTNGIRENVGDTGYMWKKLTDAVQKYYTEPNSITAAMAISHLKEKEPYQFVLFQGNKYIILEWKNNDWETLDSEDQNVELKETLQP
ncbi:uncharacterized protein LOC143245377 isoform X2 [Tachypleus tridentatus]|uniref:uncharacterized protein LOC143245377 isoform X2 n=1 Tax=Tachypleus tridentatus TaxID=6853 RepID=UPI003FD6143E